MVRATAVAAATITGCSEDRDCYHRDDCQLTTATIACCYEDGCQLTTATIACCYEDGCQATTATSTIACSSHVATT